MALAPADGAREVGDPRGAVRGAQEVPGVAHLHGRPPGRVDEAPETLVEQPEALRPARRRLHPLVQVVAGPAEQVGGVQVEAGQRARRDAEQRAGAEAG